MCSTCTHLDGEASARAVLRLGTPANESIVDRVLCSDKYGVDLAEPPATVAMPGQLGGRDGRRP